MGLLTHFLFRSRQTSRLYRMAPAQGITVKTRTPDSFLALNGQLDDLLCQLLRVDPVVWQQTKVLYASGRAWNVTTRPKRRGVRTIHEPSDPLKVMSQAILKQVIQPMPIHGCVHGGHPGTSIKTNAQVHAGFAKSYYVLDLKDAFPSTKRDRLEEYLAPKIHARISESLEIDRVEVDKIVSVLIDLMLVDDVIPQGFPTSPGVLNVVLRPTDAELSNYLRKVETELGQKFRMTRYVDDITISTDGEEIPPSVRKKVRKIICGNDWVLSRTKVRYYGEAEKGDSERSTKTAVVTGLVPHLDGRISVPRPKLSTYRGVIYRYLEIASLRENGDEKALESARVQMEQERKLLASAHVVIETTDLAEFYVGTWPLTTSERFKIVGIIGFLGMVYEGELPSRIRRVYLEAKVRFRIGRKAQKLAHYREKDSGTGPLS